MIGAIVRVRFAEVVAWRTEFLLWLVTLTMPLIMLVFWRAVARGGAFAGYDAAALGAYFVAVLGVTVLTECNAVWNINEDIRTGELSFWLVKPMHPLLSYVAITLAELPMRAVVAVPVLVVALGIGGGTGGGGVPVAGRILPGIVAIAGGLAINQAIQIAVGALGFWITKSVMVHRLFETIGAVLSGFMFPLAFLPEGLRDIAWWLPFRFILSLPVEILTGRHAAIDAWALIGVQGVVAALLNGIALFVWRRGVARYEAWG